MTCEAASAGSEPATFPRNARATPGASRRSSSGIEGDVRVRGRRLELAPHNCFACGTLNTHGLQLQLHAASDHCWTELELPDRFEGWEGMAHGGIISTILDEVMAWALVDRDSWGMTARLAVDFRRPVRIGRLIRAEGRIVDERRRLITTAGRLIDVGTEQELATATATYVEASEARKSELKARYGVRFVAVGGTDEVEPVAADVPGPVTGGAGGDPGPVPAGRGGARDAVPGSDLPDPGVS